MLPVTFQRNPTQISGCKKKLFFWQITTFAPKLQGGGVYIVHAEKNWKLSIFQTCEKSFR